VAAGAVAYTPKSGFGGGYSLEGIIPVLHEWRTYREKRESDRLREERRKREKKWENERFVKVWGFYISPICFSMHPLVSLRAPHCLEPPSVFCFLWSRFLAELGLGLKPWFMLTTPLSLLFAPAFFFNYLFYLLHLFNLR
jgi:hypothetical protein